MNNFNNKKAVEVESVSAQVLFPVIIELLAEGRQATFTVTGMSMWPLLCHKRDRVTVEKCIPEALRKGDILLLQTQLGNYLLHRITKISGSGIVTTGDGNYFRDGQFPFSCVLAKVVCLTHKGKTIKTCGIKWLVLSRLWMLLFPVRKLLFAVWFRIRKYLRH